ncbi:MAG: hypothetical protein C4581_11195 [Nitrospiraceae bacterium]|nr:MAG: hypothetical protein C4581_11195 [Nitrospiraceae bacterium]
MKKLFLTLTIILSMTGTVFAGPERVTLITEDEGAMKDAPPGLYDVGRVLNTGPEIKIISPEIADEYHPPVDINIVFEPTDDAKVDMSKFKVEYIKIMSLDITDRFLQYTTKDGIRIKNADFPRGKHKLKVTIGDDHGGITEEIFTVKLL